MVMALYVCAVHSHSPVKSTLIGMYASPLLYSTCYSGTVRVWHANTYRLESTLNYGLERVWTISMMKGSNNVALGYDEGSMLIKVILKNVLALTSSKNGTSICVSLQL
jgi:WD40 repeat protein